MSHKIMYKFPFMQTALPVQNHAKSFFLAHFQSPEISNFGNILAIPE